VEGFDLLLLVFLLGTISAAFGLSTTRAGTLMTGTLLGAVSGGIVFGLLSDAYGRVRVLTWTIVVFAVATGLCAVARGYWDLLAYRTISGLGLAASLALGWRWWRRPGRRRCGRGLRAMWRWVGRRGL
jgi:MFS family permease